jgi:cholesterol oxidase
MRLVPKRAGRGRRLRLTTRQDTDTPTPTYLPLANEFAARLAHITGGVAQSFVTEALLNTPVTAHVLGGAVPADDTSRGVIDHDHRLFGYENLIVCDGSAIAANPGVNPSLTITAMAERVMTSVPDAGAVTSGVSAGRG